MKYFIDFEFIEGFHKPLFGKRRHFIDLISIGIVAEDGRAYYAISREFNPKDADKWVVDNVISKLFFHNELRKSKSFKTILGKTGKLNDDIATEIIRFLTPLVTEQKNGFDYSGAPEFYGYYADYDWVLFCSLFGRMIDLPTGFPMYCHDLKQMVDDWVIKSLPNLSAHAERPIDFKEGLAILKANSGYPKQTNEHNALADAHWNYELYKFITS